MITMPCPPLTASIRQLHPGFYDTSRVRIDRNSEWIVRSMDDEEVFGVELYRKSYVEAVKNGWLADYRIIAVALNDPDAYEVANQLATTTESKGRNRLTTTHFLRGLAFTLAMAGATVDSDRNRSVPIKSCIAFMNTVDKSRNLAKDLQQPIVRDWLQGWLDEQSGGQLAADYSLEHLDAKSNVSKRENAKSGLAAATESNPRGILNVGIFGEGTDSPFLERRGIPGSSQKPDRRHTGRWSVHAHRLRQISGLHHLPLPHPPQCRRQKLGSATVRRRKDGRS